MIEMQTENSVIDFALCFLIFHVAQKLVFGRAKKKKGKKIRKTKNFVVLTSNNEIVSHPSNLLDT